MTATPGPPRGQARSCDTTQNAAIRRPACAVCAGVLLMAWVDNLRVKARLIRRGAPHMDESCDDLANIIERYATAMAENTTLTRCDACGADCGTMAGLVVHVHKFHPVSKEPAR